jgi:hypothetical protein
MKKGLFPIILLAAAIGVSAQEGGHGKTLVLEASKIEGKIKKPQVALISIEKRPVFKPIALTNLDTRKDITKNIDKGVFENRIYQKPFDISEKGVE